jgi:hypothetical protein
VTDCVASAHALVAAEAVPYRPNRGAHITLGGDANVAGATAVVGVAGTWTFTGTEGTLSVSWLDDDPVTVAASIPSAGRFAATLAAVDPWSSWDWFDRA